MLRFALVLLVLVSCSTDPAAPSESSASPSPSLTVSDFSGQWCRAMTPLLRVLEDAPYFPSVADEAIRDLEEASGELDELVSGLDDAKLRDVADDVRLLEAGVDAWRASLDVDIGADPDALVDAMDAQADATEEMSAPIERLVDEFGGCG